ncbi:RNA-dependent RNA polymerase 1 [Neolecta irregularis DAH-3]|uniref:RNA-dependent RNA polymerase n=1 Tax=Neolecta irregularis (strain DAH-3) TaxID=1198029 RepID=A0A1U7LIB4_NEOID|nr:RNA-dependent RNA polymerase 1 [Neolecta irregularis DAH-3]|eukprot:OLL22395.1 RNA-dependent RNA polymerase 1 [Neolecta irregularis DAH-3]
MEFRISGIPYNVTESTLRESIADSLRRVWPTQLPFFTAVVFAGSKVPTPPIGIKILDFISQGNSITCLQQNLNLVQNVRNFTKFEMEALLKAHTELQDETLVDDEPENEKSLRTAALRTVSCGVWSSTGVYLEQWKSSAIEIVWESEGRRFVCSIEEPIDTSNHINMKIVIQKSQVNHLIKDKANNKLYIENSVTPQFLNAGRNELLHSVVDYRPSDTRKPCINEDHGTVAAFCYVYCFEFLESHILAQFWDTKNCFNVHSISKREYGRETLSKLDIFYRSLPITVAHQCHRLVSSTYLLPSEMNEIRHNIYASRLKDRILASRLRSLSDLAIRSPLNSYPSEYEFCKTILDVIDSPVTAAETSRLDIPAENHIWVHQAVCTPSGIYLEGPEVDQGNRIMRLYPNHHDHFLRVTFADEHFERLHFNPEVSLDDILQQRFKKILAHSFISVAGREYRYLAYSQSSLREHTVWFMTPFEYKGQRIDPEGIRSSIGDLSRIRCPPRYAARMAQAFTTTLASVKLLPHEINKIPDVERNGYCFSDGVGKISSELLKDVLQTLDMDSQTTVLQIRFGGAKGVVALDTSLLGRQLCLRPSMRKFEAPLANILEIASAATRSLQMFLNRPLITILETLGVPIKHFLDLQNQAIKLIEERSSDIRRIEGLYNLYGLGQAIRMGTTMKLLSKRFPDYDVLAESEFLRSCNTTGLRFMLKEIKYRSRIPVPRAALLKGILDETDTLLEDEVYVAFTDSQTQRKVKILGQIIVSRSPAMHPGDVQFSQAVDVDQSSPLRALNHCIVFSQKGYRPLPSMLGGGDLDGDDYNVIWDQTLLPPRIFPPASYHAPKPLELDRPCIAKDIIDFFIDFIMNDNLGLIASLHQNIADRDPEGVKAAACISLAEMHSTAVDFPKTGIKVNMRNAPRATDAARPDFRRPEWAVDLLESQHRPKRERGVYYESKKALGMLFRSMNVRQQTKDYEGKYLTHLPDRLRSNKLNLWIFNQSQKRWREHRSLAEDIYRSYVKELKIFQTDYSPSRANLTEEEVVMGCILSASSTTRGRRSYDLIQTLREQYHHLAYDIRLQICGHLESPKDIFARAALLLYFGCR